jgi:hypothetical protein
MNGLKLGGFVAGLLLVCGCSNPKPTVSGTVRLDGYPLTEGRITFEPEDETRAPGGGAIIKNGKYLISEGLAAGKFRVRINALRKTERLIQGPIAPSALVKEEVEAVAAEFNKKSDLIREVKTGPNTFDFDVKATESPVAPPAGR